MTIAEFNAEVFDEPSRAQMVELSARFASLHEQWAIGDTAVALFEKCIGPFLGIVRAYSAEAPMSELTLSMILNAYGVTLRMMRFRGALPLRFQRALPVGLDYATWTRIIGALTAFNPDATSFGPQGGHSWTPQGANANAQTVSERALSTSLAKAFATLMMLLCMDDDTLKTGSKEAKDRGSWMLNLRKGDGAAFNMLCNTLFGLPVSVHARKNQCAEAGSNLEQNLEQYRSLSLLEGGARTAEDRGYMNADRATRLMELGILPTGPVTNEAAAGLFLKIMELKADGSFPRSPMQAVALDLAHELALAAPGGAPGSATQPISLVEGSVTVAGVDATTTTSTSSSSASGAQAGAPGALPTTPFVKGAAPDGGLLKFNDYALSLTSSPPRCRGACCVRRRRTRMTTREAGGEIRGSGACESRVTQPRRVRAPRDDLI